MSFVVKQFNKETQKEGQWVEFEGADLLIAYAQNPEFQKAHRQLTKPFRRQLEKGTLDVEKEEELLCEAMATGLLLDWKRVKFEEDGDDVPYTQDLAKQALILNPELREFVAGFSYELDNFRNKDIESTAKK